jgi:hypothetical protein
MKITFLSVREHIDNSLVIEVIEDAGILSVISIYSCIDFIDTNHFRKRDSRNNTVPVKDSGNGGFR